MMKNQDADPNRPKGQSSSEEIDLLAQVGAKTGPGTPPRELGDYRIIGKIASGGMATIYEAEQISLKRRVALKILPPHLSDSAKAVRRFQREAEAGGRQSHHAIVQIYAVGEQDGTHYIAEELVEGGHTLADSVREMEEEKSLPVGYYRRTAKIIADVAEALEHAHESGVIHRDVKPTNILVTPDGKPKVTDFGLAKVQDALSLSRTGEFMGTPFYMSPEQAMSRRIGIDKRTDVYSLGVTLYEVITLKRPFEGKTSHEILKKIIFHEPSDPCRLNPRVPRDLAIICLKAMEKKPSLRYQSMQELADDLGRFLDNEVILAKPAGFPTRFAKRIRRYPKTSFAAAVIAVAVIAMGINGLWFLSELNAERKKTAAVNEFLADVFLSPDPDLSGKDVKVVEYLAKAAAEAEEKFKDEPGIRALLYLSIADTYSALGVFDEAERFYGTSAEIGCAAEGPDHTETLRALCKQAGALNKLGNYSGACALYSKVLETWLDDPGKEDRNTLDALEGKAGALWKTGELDNAEEIYRDVLQTRQRVLSPGHERTLRTMNALGCFLMEVSNESDEAESLLQAALDGRWELLGPRHTNTLESMINLAKLFKTKREFERAEGLYREALAIQLEILPPEHPDIYTTMNNLAVVAKLDGRYGEAKEILEKVVAKLTESFGSSHPNTLQAKSNLAMTLWNMDRKDLAEDQYLEILRIVERNPDKEYVNEHFWLSNLAQLYIQLHRYADAEPLSQRALDKRSGLFGAKHQYVLRSVTQLASIRLRRNKPDDAIVLLRDYSVFATSGFPKDNVDRIDYHDLYAECLHALQRYEEAAEQVFHCYEGAAGTPRRKQKDYVGHLIRLYDRANRPEEVEKYQAIARSLEKDEN